MTPPSPTANDVGVLSVARVLFTVHGVNSDSDKLSRIQDECRTNIPDLNTETCSWQKFFPWRLFDDATATLVKDYVRKSLLLTFRQHSDRGPVKLTVVAHSYGTLAVLKVMQDHLPGLQIGSLVLLGSIIPRDQQWDGFIANRQLSEPPLAIIRPFDWIVRLSRVYNGQASGALGFIPQGMHRPIEIYKHGGHTSYFPADCEDIRNVVLSGVSGVKAVSRDEWFDGLRPSNRVRLTLTAAGARIAGWLLTMMRSLVPRF